jgi:hypothetical protein
MSDNGEWYSPNYTPQIRQPRAGELLYEFMRADNVSVRVELRDHGSYGVEAQIYLRGDFRLGRRFQTRALAVEWAEAARPELERSE